MPKLLIKRNSEWANKMRNFELYLNGRKFTYIKDRQLLSLEIPEGTYRLEARIDWCGSKPLDFEVKKGDIKRIEIRGFIFSRYFLPVALAIVLLYTGINLYYHINSLFLAAVMMGLFGYLLYFISFGRHQYLRLIEIS